ncbi:YceI family protein [Pseudonocardia sp. CA-107938]|uniref:YceI family protein n=1 Tax=Pseudonocardia sp. CA-107938 TaxID=3240021 RepID=UPI003D8ED9DE
MPPCANCSRSVTARAAPSNRPGVRLVEDTDHGGRHDDSNAGTRPHRGHLGHRPGALDRRVQGAAPDDQHGAGRFATFDGSIHTGDHVTESTVTATIDATSIDTGNTQRDAHIRSADFFDTDNHPTWTFRSTDVHASGEELLVEGYLTINRNDFGVDIAMPLDGGGVVVGDTVHVELEIQGVLRQDA